MDLTRILYNRWMIIKKDQFKLVDIEVTVWALESVLFITSVTPLFLTSLGPKFIEKNSVWGRKRCQHHLGYNGYKLKIFRGWFFHRWFRFWSVVIFFTFDRTICSVDTSRLYCNKWPNSWLVRFIIWGRDNCNTRWNISWQEPLAYILITKYWNSSSSNFESKWTFYLPQWNGLRIIIYCPLFISYELYESWYIK